jgi:nitric oxide reductase large subunit
VNIIKTIVIALGAVLAALVIVPLTVLAGLFVWLKLTEETDEDEMELDDAV